MIITRVAVENRLTVVVLMLGVILVGGFCYLTLPREAAPEVKIPIIMVSDCLP